MLCFILRRLRDTATYWSKLSEFRNTPRVFDADVECRNSETRFDSDS